MTTLQELLQDRVLPGHCFTPTYYIRPDIHSGLLESRGGYRLAAFPEALVRAMYSGLRYETGQATRVILYNCGRDWGQEFFERFEEELSQYRGEPLGDMPIGILIDSLTDLWATHGWGRLQLHFEHSDRGVVEATVFNSGFAKAALASLPEETKPDEPSCYMEAGVLASVFSALSGRALSCVQTTCESLGADRNRFIITTAERLQSCADWIRKGMSHAEIVDKLIAN